MAPNFKTFSGDLLFSLKTYIAAIASLYIAFLWNLSQPYWALLTVMIVAQPYTGMVRSKALYRFLGTFIGASAAVILVPNLVDLPELLTFSMALWIGLCLYLSLIDGTPRSYAFILSGYTAALIGFPSVEHPRRIFPTAVTRVEEVCLGILCTFIVNELFFPRSSSALFMTRVGKWLSDTSEWAREILKGTAPPSVMERRNHHLSIEMVALDALALFASYDARDPREVEGMNLLRRRLGGFIPLLSEITRHIDELKIQAPKRLQEIQPFLKDIADGIRPTGPSPSLLVAVQKKSALAPGAKMDSAPLETSLMALIGDFLERWHDCQALHLSILQGGDQDLPAPSTPTNAHHRDHLLAGLSALAAILSVSLSSAFWILSQWPEGAVATMMAAVVSSFFAFMDDPAPAILKFLVYMNIGSIVGLLFLYTLLPMAHDFLGLSVLLALVLIPSGVFLARPEKTIQVLAFTIGFAGLIALSSAYSADFAHTLNTALAQSFGVFLAAGVTRLTRSVGADWSARRLVRADWNDLARIAAGVEMIAPSSAEFTTDTHESLPLKEPVRMTERTGQLAIRLQAISPEERRLFSPSLLHVGLARKLMGLVSSLNELPPQAKEAVSSLLGSLSLHFERFQANGDMVCASLEDSFSRTRKTLSDWNEWASVRNALVLLAGIHCLLSLPSNPRVTPLRRGKELS
ncbi:MAG: FUSC family protein [Leptospirales bacterium]